MISNFLFFEDDASLQEKYDYVQLKLEIRELLKDNFNRKVLVEILLDLQKDISGDARQRLFNLYRNLGLHLDAFDKLKSRRWEVISRGILELTQLQVEESYSSIKKFINHKRGVIRKQAQLATVSLKHEGITYFLDTCKYRISEWQQLKLLDIIRNLEDFQPPRFKAWLTSKNGDVVLFALRLIKYYKQNDANTSLMVLVKHKNDQIKIEAINCIKEFCVFEALHILKAVFWNCRPHVKLLVLDALADLGGEGELIFLKSIENKENNFMVKSKALSAINTISPGAVMPTKDIEFIRPYEEQQEEMTDAIAPVAEEPTKEMIPDFDPGTENQDGKMLIEGPEGPQEAVHKLHEHEVPGEKITEPEPEISEYGEETPKETAPDPSEQPKENKVEIAPVVEQPDKNLGELTLDVEEYMEESAPEFEVTGMHDGEQAYWEAVLDPENEDVEIFEICLLEELQDILTEAERPDESYSDDEILPLNFLPIIEEDPKGKDKKEKIPEHIVEMEVDGEMVHEDEKFRVELDSILQRIRGSEEKGEEDTVVDFLPLVAGSETSSDTDKEEVGPEQPIREFNVDYKEVRAIPEEPEMAFSLGPTRTSLEELPAKNPGLMEVFFEEEEPPLAEMSCDKSIEKGASDLSRLLDERVSIFNELFKTCDAESKLILLDEILAVGDEKDLRFLDTLGADEDSRVRKKALTIKKKLGDFLKRNRKENERMNADHLHGEAPENDDISGADVKKEEPDTPNSPAKELSNDLTALEYRLLAEKNIKTSRTSGILDVDFELTPLEEAQSQNLGGAISESSFLYDILSIPSKIIQKLNG